MAMNKRQKEYLSDLVCQRLRDDPANEELVQKFINVVNPNIAEALTETGWESDAEGKLAFYIIKDRKLDMPLLFFSLRCGEMHKPLDPEKLLRKVRNSLMLLNEALTVCRYIPYLGSDDPQENFDLRQKCHYAQTRARTVVPNEWAKGVISKQLVDGKEFGAQKAGQTVTSGEFFFQVAALAESREAAEAAVAAGAFVVEKALVKVDSESMTVSARDEGISVVVIDE